MYNYAQKYDLHALNSHSKYSNISEKKLTMKFLKAGKADF